MQLQKVKQAAYRKASRKVDNENLLKPGKFLADHRADGEVDERLRTYSNPGHSPRFGKES